MDEQRDAYLLKKKIRSYVEKYISKTAFYFELLIGSIKYFYTLSYSQIKSLPISFEGPVKSL